MRLARLTVLPTLALALLAAPMGAGAQQPTKVYRIGALGNALPTSPQAAPLWKAFAEGMHEQGLNQGQHFVMEYRWNEGSLERSPSLAAELVGLKVDLIVAAGTANVRAAKQATSVLPIVMVYVVDPVAGGLVDSLARPGGNVTGVAFGAGLEIVGKHLELLKQATSKVSRVAVLSDPAHPLDSSYRKEAQTAAGALGVTLQFYDVRDPSDLEGAFGTMIKSREGALLVLTQPFAFVHARRIADLAANNRLPAVYPFRESVEAGGFMAYAANSPDMFRRAATFVDKILKGAKPADLPVEQSTKFDMVINMRTAKALGLTIPPAVLARADEVIQ
jgi:putative tryptophan/tyrosine transport system substrate-binding protein